MELKLYYFKSESIELYYGIEYWKLHGYFNGNRFHFVLTASSSIDIRCDIKPIKSDKIGEEENEILYKKNFESDELIKFHKWIFDKFDEKLYLPDFKQINNNIEEEFNPVGFFKQEYQRIENLIEDVELKEKLVKLAKNAPPDTEASVNMHPR